MSKGFRAPGSKFTWLFGLVLGLTLFIPGCGLLQRPPLQTPTSVHLVLGNPSQATTDPRNADNYLMLKPQYALSYNNSKRTANWVSWELQRSWLGAVDRSNDFRPDDMLPEGWYRVTSSDYLGSGYDRGHMIPSGDRTNSRADNSATFLMTNILPQAGDNNKGPWADLEVYCRDLVKTGKHLAIVAGGYGKKQVLVRGNITVPSTVWKVIVVRDRSGSNLSDISVSTRVIAVWMPNVNGIRGVDWRNYRVSVDKIEAATKYDLLSNVPESVQKVIEARVDRV